MKNAWVYNMKDEPVGLATELEIELSQSNVPSGIFTCPMTGDSLYVQERRDEEEEEKRARGSGRDTGRQRGGGERLARTSYNPRESDTW